MLGLILRTIPCRAVIHFVATDNLPPSAFCQLTELSIERKIKL